MLELVLTKLCALLGAYWDPSSEGRKGGTAEGTSSSAGWHCLRAGSPPASALELLVLVLGSNTNPNRGSPPASALELRGFPAGPYFRF